MMTIAICGNNPQFDKKRLQNLIEHFMGQNNSAYKIYIFSSLSEVEEAIMPLSFDIYIIDIDTCYDKLVIDNANKSYFIFVGNNLSNIFINNEMANNYFITHPIDADKLKEIIEHIRRKIQKNCIVVQTVDGATRLSINEVNYINIEGRNLCYHLINGENEYSYTLTTSFKKAITPLDQHELLCFLPPSLLLNITKVRTIGTNYVIFENKDTLYVPTTQRKVIQAKWEEFNNFDNLLRENDPQEIKEKYAKYQEEKRAKELAEMK